MKTSASVYVKEYNNEVTWDENNKVCISVQTLVSKGYIKKIVLFDIDYFLTKSNH